MHAVRKPASSSNLVKISCQFIWLKLPNIKNNIMQKDAIYPAASAVYIRKPAFACVLVNPIILSMRLMFMSM